MDPNTETKGRGQMVSPSAVVAQVIEKAGVDAFDLELTKQVWESAFVRNPSGNFWIFTIKIPGNGTKLIVGVSRGMAVTLHIDLLTVDCPPLNLGKHKPHQRLASLGFHGIEKIIYHLGEGYIDFQFSRASGQNDRSVRIFRHGYFWADCS